MNTRFQIAVVLAIVVLAIGVITLLDNRWVRASNCPAIQSPVITGLKANRDGTMKVEVAGQVVTTYHSVDCWMYYPDGRPVMRTDPLELMNGKLLQASCK